jgi:glycosyltransferase involved in cell wall biosynthesis
VRLLAVGEGLGGSGYGRVMETLLAELAGTFEVTLFAVDHRGPDSGWVRGNRVPGDNYGVDQLPALLEEVDPDVVLLHRNAAFHSMHRTALAASRARVVVYSPADRVVDSLADADLVVFYTRAGLEAAGAGLPSVAVIPHGVDRSRFFPVPDARRQLGLDDDAFVVLNANRNITRKRVDVTMRGFALFARSRPDAWLYLHMGMRDLGVDVPALAAELGIADRLLATWGEAGHPHVPDERLNLVYNACDAGVNTASAEGFGLVALEHAATGAAQIVPALPSLRELWGEAALVLDAPPSPEAVAHALGRLYDDRSLLAERGRAAFAHATSERFSWPAIARQWSALLRGCAEAEAAAPLHAAAPPPSGGVRIRATWWRPT